VGMIGLVCLCRTEEFLMKLEYQNPKFETNSNLEYLNKKNGPGPNRVRKSSVWAVVFIIRIWVIRYRFVVRILCLGFLPLAVKASSNSYGTEGIAKDLLESNGYKWTAPLRLIDN
jgi:hypothetical protein